MCEIVNVTYQSDGQSPGGVGKEMVHLVYHVVGIFDIRHLNQIWKRRLIKDGDITKQNKWATMVADLILTSRKANPFDCPSPSLTNDRPVRP